MRERGFTLIETLMVVVVLGIAAVTISSLQGNIFKGQSVNKDIQVGVQLMQECAEQVLAVRQTSGFAGVSGVNFGINKCGAMSALGAYSLPSVSFISPYTDVACPSGGTCKLVSITQGGLAPITLVLVDH